MAFGNVLRTSALTGVVDFQRAALALGTLLEHSGDSGVIDLGPLYDFLMEQGAPEHAVVEVIVFMKSRQSRFNVEMTMPARLANLNQQDFDSIVLAFTSRGANSGTRAVPPGPGPRELGAPTGGASPSPSPSPSPPSPGSSPSPFTSSPGTGSGSQTSTKNKALFGVLGLVSVLAIANVVYVQATKEPPPEPQQLVDPAGLQCSSAVIAKTTLLCKMPKAKFNAEPPEAMKVRGQVTKAAMAKKGVTRILVMLDEDGMVQAVF